MNIKRSKFISKCDRDGKGKGSTSCVLTEVSTRIWSFFDGKPSGKFLSSRNLKSRSSANLSWLLLNGSPTQKLPPAALKQENRIFFLLKTPFSKFSVLPLDPKYLSVVPDNWNKDFSLGYRLCLSAHLFWVPRNTHPYHIIGCLKLDFLFPIQIQDQIYLLLTSSLKTLVFL